MSGSASSQRRASFGRPRPSPPAPPRLCMRAGWGREELGGRLAPPRVGGRADLGPKAFACARGSSASNRTAGAVHGVTARARGPLWACLERSTVWGRGEGRERRGRGRRRSAVPRGGLRGRERRGGGKGPGGGGGGGGGRGGGGGGGGRGRGGGRGGRERRGEGTAPAAACVCCARSKAHAPAPARTPRLLSPAAPRADATCTDRGQRRPPSAPRLARPRRRGHAQQASDLRPAETTRRT